jgi:hypothetical protein
MNEQKKLGNDPYHIYGIGLLTGEKITAPMGSFSIGHSSNALESHSFAFGDYTTTNKKHQTVVGTHLFREEIPQEVREWVVENPERMKSLIQAICNCRTTNEFTGDLFVVKWFANAFYEFVKEDREASDVDK